MLQTSPATIMPVRGLALIVVAISLLGATARPQCPPPLTTTFSGGNTSNGNFFDIVSTNPLGVLITSFSVNMTSGPGGTGNIEIYRVTAGGSYVGNEATPANWTLVGSVQLVSAGSGVPTPVLINVNTTIPVGATQGFYVTHSDGQLLNYTNGTVEGAVFASDGNIDVLEGKGVVYPFGATFTPRVWNGVVNYLVGGVGQQYQTNSLTASLTLDGQSGGPCSPLIIGKLAVTCGAGSPATGTVALASVNNVGSLYEVAMSSGPILAPGVVVSGEILNLGFLPPLSFANGGSLPQFQPFLTIPGATGASITVPYSFLTNVSVAFQGVITDPTSPAGFRFTAPAQLLVSAQPMLTQLPGPTGDDSFVVVNVTQCPTPWSPTGIAHFGVVYNEYYVSSNGKITFGGPDIDFSPTITEAMTGLPFIGCWTDLDPTLGGQITVDLLSGGRKFKTTWDVPYWGQAGALNGGNVEHNKNNHEERVSKLDQMLPNPSSDMFLGISPGGVGGATDGGTTLFTPGGSGGPPLVATDMIYDFGVGQLPPSLQPGTLVCVMFIPVGNTYAWVGL